MKLKINNNIVYLEEINYMLYILIPNKFMCNQAKIQIDQPTQFDRNSIGVGQFGFEHIIDWILILDQISHIGLGKNSIRPNPQPSLPVRNRSTHVKINKIVFPKADTTNVFQNYVFWTF